MVSNRKPTQRELSLIKFLIEKSSLVVSSSWEDEITICPMQDGGMGSFYIYPNGKPTKGRKFGEQVSEFIFHDLDGIEVIASLNIDENGELFELDIWKTNFEKLLSLPKL